MQEDICYQENIWCGDWLVGLRREWVGKFVLYERAIFKVIAVVCGGYLEISGNSFKYGEV